MNFSNNPVFITGGASGIGFAVARRLTDMGGQVVLLGRDSTKGKAAAAQLKGCSFETLDLRDLQQVQSVAQQLLTRYPNVRYLVNAAGVFSPKAFTAHTSEDYDSYFNINRGTFFLTQAVANAMVAHGKGGAVVNVGSMWAHQAVKATPFSAYSMAKAGMHALTQHLAMELAEFNIRVNAVAPAVVNTPVYEAFIPKEQVQAALAGFNAFHPLGRVGTPDEVASAIAFRLVRRCVLDYRYRTQRG
jgi:NAD(P)-dependent dehydrogenase (short-subunit alcohol dehydrogenase family)